MASVNRVIILGFLGQDPEVRYTQTGEAVVNLNIATSEQWKDKATGEKREATEWHRVGIFGKPAEIAGQYLTKGSQVYVEGKIRSKKYKDKDGIERTAFEILCESFKMLGKPNDAKPAAPKQQAVKQQAAHDDMDDLIPF